MRTIEGFVSGPSGTGPPEAQKDEVQHGTGPPEAQKDEVQQVEEILKALNGSLVEVDDKRAEIILKIAAIAGLIGPPKKERKPRAKKTSSDAEPQKELP